MPLGFTQAPHPPAPSYLSESRGLLNLRNLGNWAQVYAHSVWALKHAQLAGRLRMDMLLLLLLCTGIRESKHQPRVEKQLLFTGKRYIQSRITSSEDTGREGLGAICDLSHLPHKPMKDELNRVSFSFYMRLQVPKHLANCSIPGNC